MDKKHQIVKLIFKIVGIILLLAGLSFCALAFADLFTKVGTDDNPVYFWALYIGLPLLAMGIVVTVSGFRKETTTYIKNDFVETQKEVVEDNDISSESTLDKDLEHSDKIDKESKDK